MKEFFDIDINAYSTILDRIIPFVEIDDKRFDYKNIKQDSKFINGGLLGLIGIEITKYNHLVIVSNNSFLGDNLTLTLPVVKYIKNIGIIEKIDVFLPFPKLFKSDGVIDFIDYKDYSLIQSKITKNTLILTFSLIEGEFKEMIKSLNSDVLIGLNDKHINYYNAGKLVRTLICSFYDSDFFSQNYTECIRSQLNINSKYRTRSNFEQRELLEIVNSYLHRTNQNWDNHPYWGKILNGDFSDANNALYSNVYECDLWMFKLLFGLDFKWLNFQDLIAPKDFSFARNEKLSKLFSPYVLVNINANTVKLTWQNTKTGIIQYISSILKNSLQFNYNVIFTHPSFDDEINDNIYSLFSNQNENVFILSPDDIVDWIPFMKKAESIVSFDTGFVHLAYLYNSKVLSVGGDSFLWHFPDTEYITFNHIDSLGNVKSDRFYSALNKVLNWIRND